MKKETNPIILGTTSGIFVGSICFLLQNNYFILMLFAVLFLFLAVIITVTDSAVPGKDLMKSRAPLIFISFSFLLLTLTIGRNSTFVVGFSVLSFSITELIASFAGLNYLILKNEKNKVLNVNRILVFILINFIVLSALYISLLFVGIKQFGLYSVITFYSFIIISILYSALKIFISENLQFLIIPFFIAILLFLFLKTGNNYLLNNFLLGVLFAFIVAFLSGYYNLLTLDGEAATFVLASLIFGFGGMKWTLPILTFFILSSVISKVRKHKDSEVEGYFEKSDKRDSLQVLANGGLAGVIIILNQFFTNEIFYYAYVASLAAVCSDTWSTEIGTYFKKKTLNIIGFQVVEPGFSGGVSLPGIIGGILGAFMIAISSLNWVSINIYLFIFLVITSGVLGSLIDSLLGASFQAKYVCASCGKLTERKLHCEKVTSLKYGYKWFNNDLVNIMAAAAGSISIILFLKIV